MVAAAFVNFETVYFPAVIVRAKGILFAPATSPEMLWIIIPLLITLFVMETYFGRYANDELGWNTATGNALVLLFVAMDLFRTLIGQLPTPHTGALVVYHLTTGKFILAILVGVGGIYLLLTNFFRILPKQIAFELSSAFPINFIAYTALVLVYGNLPLDWYTFFGSVLLFGLLAMFFWFFRLLIPYAHPEYKRRKVAEQRE